MMRNSSSYKHSNYHRSVVVPPGQHHHQQYRSRCRDHPQSTQQQEEQPRGAVGSHRSSDKRPRGSHGAMTSIANDDKVQQSGATRNSDSTSLERRSNGKQGQTRRERLQMKRDQRKMTRRSLRYRNKTGHHRTNNPDRDKSNYDCDPSPGQSSQKPRQQQSRERTGDKIYCGNRSSNNGTTGRLAYESDTTGASHHHHLSHQTEASNSNDKPNYNFNYPYINGQLVQLIKANDVEGVALYLETDNLSKKQQYILNQYDEKNEATPVHVACRENNVEILKLLLQYNPNVNLLYKPNTRKITTMHFAATRQNVSMMKLLIQNGFKYDKFINNIYYYGDHRSVFLQLCSNGNVECLNYLMNKCKNKIDIWQRDIEGRNGLHLAVYHQHLSMVEYLLNSVYNNDEMKRKIFGQTIGISNKYISVLAAEKAITQDGLTIFQLLRQNKCPIHDDCILYAASFSSLALEYMMNQQLYPNYIYLSDTLIDTTIKNAHVHLVHKNVLIIVKYLGTVKDKVSMNEYQEWIINIFSTIMMNGTMDGYFKMFKEMIGIILNNHDWKYFRKSKIIDKKLLGQIKKKINDPTNVRDLCDEKWRVLLETMIDSFDGEALLNKYDYDGNEHNESDIDSDDGYYCHKNHRMSEIDNANNLNDKTCTCCNGWSEMNSFACVKCDEYICNPCLKNMTQLMQLLRNRQFEQFEKTLNQYKIIRQKNMISMKAVRLQTL